MEINIPSVAGYVSTGVAVLMALGAFISYRASKRKDAHSVIENMKAQIAGKLDRAEHLQICDKANLAITEKLDLVIDRIDESSRARERLSDSLQALAQDAKIAQNKINEDLHKMSIRLEVITALSGSKQSGALVHADSLRVSVEGGSSGSQGT